MSGRGGEGRGSVSIQEIRVSLMCSFGALFFCLRAYGLAFLGNVRFPVRGTSAASNLRWKSCRSIGLMTRTARLGVLWGCHRGFRAEGFRAEGFRVLWVFSGFRVWVHTIGA